MWGQATSKAPQLPSPADFGCTWEVANAQWNMKWMTFPPAGAACRAAIKCGCTKGWRSLQVQKGSVVVVNETDRLCCI